MKRLLPVIVALVVVLVVVGVITAAVTRDGGGADAYTVNGESVSQRVINEELGQLAANELATSNSRGSVDARSSASWLTTRIRAKAVGELLESNDLELTAVDRAQVRGQLPPGFSNLPKATQDLVLQFSGGGQLLVNELGEDGANEALAEVARKYDVSVDPKYGRWVRAQAQVCPPRGCAPLNQATGSG